MDVPDPHPAEAPTPTSRALLCISLWIPLLLVGLAATWNYELRPGLAAEAPARWPTQHAGPTPDQWTLLLFAHPRCPCTRASVAELERLLVRAAVRPDVRVHFYLPAEEASDWARTATWRHAARLPGVAVHTDVDGELARAFGAHTSGQVLLYDARGRLAFEGGLTPSRGHEGDNSGRFAIEELLAERAPRERSSPVFGCELIGSCRPDSAPTP